MRNLIKLLIRVCLPMFTFALAVELFKFQYDNPAFVPLFQLPPKCASVHLIPLKFYIGG
jgi:hypothetical protein